MIEQTHINGEPVIVTYLRGEMEPCNPEEATYIKVRFEDGRIMFAFLAGSDTKTEITEEIIDTMRPKKPRTISSQKYKVKKKPNERRPVISKSAKVETPKAPPINYAMLSNYSLGQRARWGDQFAVFELERRHRQEAQEPEQPQEPKHDKAYEPHVHGIDQRLPTSKVLAKQIGNKYDEKRKVDVASLKATPELYEKNVRLVKDYPNMQKGSEKLSTDELAEKFISHVEDNLLYLHDQVPKEIRARSKLWYDGANRIATRWANQYKLPLASVAGCIAALSPQMDWYKNVSLAGRVLEYTRGDEGHMQKKYTPEMDEVFLGRAAFRNKEEHEKTRAFLKGKSMADIDAIEDMSIEAKAAAKAMWINLYDRAHGSTDYQIVSPEGEFTGPAKKPNGEMTKAAFMSLNPIAKAIISIDAQGDINKISPTMGDKHKVRNFFNNIFNPNSPDGDVTIDTHAVAAGLMRPLSGAAVEVNHNLDSSMKAGDISTGSSAQTGVNGTYALYADAYRRAAQKRGIQPREMQSITWEAIRGLYTGPFKNRKKNKKGMDAVDEVWNQYKEGFIDIHTARKKVTEIAGGIRPPTWITGIEDEEEETNNEAPEAQSSNKKPNRRIVEVSGDSGNQRELYRLGIRGKSTSGMALRARIRDAN